MDQTVYERAIVFEALVQSQSGSYAKARALFESGARAAEFEAEVRRRFDCVRKGHWNFEVVENTADGSMPFLYLAGDRSLLGKRSAAIVGTRLPSVEARVKAAEAARTVCEAGLTVVSGLAQGVDSVAHLTALEVGGRTVAFIPFSFGSECYPRQNRELLENIAEDGLVVSPFAPGFVIQKWAFLYRSRLVALYSDFSFLIEDSEEGGARKECDAALRSGKKILLPSGFWEEEYRKWKHKFDGEERLSSEFNGFVEIRQQREWSLFD